MTNGELKIESIALLESEVMKTGQDYLENEGFTEIIVPRMVRAKWFL